MSSKSPLERQADDAERLFAELQEPAAIAALDGPPGSGKSTLGRSVARRWEASGLGKAEWISCGAGFQLADATDLIVRRFQRREGRHLLIIDDGYNEQPGGIEEFIARLSTGPWTFSTLLISVSPEGWPMPVVTLGGMSRAEIEELWRSSGLDPAGCDFNQLLELSRGSPQVIGAVLDFQVATGGLSAGPIDLLKPWSNDGLFNNKGVPFDASLPAGRRIVADIRSINEELIRSLAAKPDLLYRLDPRKFEELVAELFSRSGYEVELTPATRDGGKDLYVARHDQFGRFMTIVECKRYAADCPVGIGVIRALHGTADAERANAAMVVTTSTFSRDATEFSETLGYQMQLRDYFHVRDWLQSKN